MKNLKLKTGFIFVMVCFVIQSLCAAAWAVEIDPNDPSTIEAAKVEIRQNVEEFPPKVEELKTKSYSGTFSEIMALRVVDVNNVAVEAKRIVEKAQQICEVEGVKVEKQDALKGILEKGTKKEGLELKKVLNEFTLILNDDLEALNTEDPNYVADASELSLVVAWLLDIDQELP